ncbi:O-antigen ligase family protein [uncultured Maribacter sp.]|uniref:O-antigen ligase family protein n=1 Tax=uncultured Maribacter sp. TaxID=431308 RepID=UPI00262B3574|nr:O-antigen ligase family protein [uncultured Maribacter sp.]
MLKDFFDLRGIEKWKNIILLIFSFSLPLNQKWSTILLLVLIVISLFDKKDYKLFRNISFILPIILYISTVASLFYSHNFELKFIEHRASLIGIPLIFLTIKIDYKAYSKILRYFVLGCLTAVFICYINALNNSFSIVDSEIKFQAVVNQEFSFLYSVVRDGNYFFSSFFSIFHDTTYFSIYLNVAIVIILFLRLWKLNKWYYLLLLLFPMVIFQLSSKVGIIILFFIFIFFIFSRIKKMSLKMALLILITILGALFFQYNPRLKSMSEKFSKEKLTINPEERFGYTLRLMSWDAALELIKENPIKGLGVGDTQIKLNEKYIKKGYATPLKQNLNAHNEFFQIFLESGLVGFLSILLILYSLFKFSIVNNKIVFFNMCFLFIITISFLFESILNRYSGISFFTFFYYIILNRYVENNDK